MEYFNFRDDPGCIISDNCTVQDYLSCCASLKKELIKNEQTDRNKLDIYTVIAEFKHSILLIV